MKGFFSQGVIVLLAAPATLDEVCQLVPAAKPSSKQAASEQWEISGPSVLVPYRPDVNGYVTIDLVDHPWPDGMGDPQKEPQLFASWSMGHFGPFAYPGNLERAVQHSWVWPKAKEVAPRHRAFVRVRTSYIFGADKSAKCLPKDYDALPELKFVTDIAIALLRHPNALCYFNPSGEVLLGGMEVIKADEHGTANGFAPLNIWSNVRMFALGREWMMMDSIGMEQLDRRDHQACFQSAKYQPGKVAGFLRNMTLYELDEGEIVKDGDTTDGPGGVRWKARSFEKSMAPPPNRRLLQWHPCDGSTLPPAMGAQELP